MKASKVLLLVLTLALVFSGIGIAGPVRSAAAQTIETETEPLKKGDKGDAVVELQQMLVEHNYLNGSADGDFGKKTEQAVKDLQEDAGLEVTGIADQATMDALDSQYADFEPSKKNDALMYYMEFVDDTGLLEFRIKNLGSEPITQLTFEVHQCNANKSSLGSFYGKRNTKRYQYWASFSTECYIDSGDYYSVYLDLTEGNTVEFSNGEIYEVQYFEKGKYARIKFTKFKDEDGKSHKVSQTLYSAFR